MNYKEQSRERPEQMATEHRRAAQECEDAIKTQESQANITCVKKGLMPDDEMDLGISPLATQSVSESKEKSAGQIIYDFRQKTIDGHMPDWDDEESVSDEDREWYEEQANEVLKNDTIRKQLVEALGMAMTYMRPVGLAYLRCVEVLTAYKESVK